ncbi:reverse transcriptase domain-containing protein [Thiothrix lacustris]|uniref:reverse transcriptase domain-containing protein n=1 Tax=Thiothrix lacustris TaxID=525917 RepID=UPI0027E58EDF|nr:reverse transcriptase domain-containing protein [Thiothrix lacustris]WMP17329.1 reverse transcriptase domain-containing protein [Thiothrix lacustris]
MLKADLLEQVLHPDVLDEAWRRVRTEHTPWSKGVDRDQLEQHLLRHILRLLEDIRLRRYRPEPLRQFTIPKTDGSKRVISAQYLRDKFLQRAILTVLEPRAERLFHADSYAYRPNRGVQDALKKARERIGCGLDWLVDADIRSFFDQIPQTPLKKKLKGFVDDKAVMVLLELWLKQGAHHTSLLGSDRGISQGAILSPLMCNLYLHDFDIALEKANIPFVRYADDFLLFTSSNVQAEQALDYVRSLLKKLDLELKDAKTRVVRSSPEVVFLGERLPVPKR